MKEDPQPGEIHAARCMIEDRQAFLAYLQDIGREFSTCIICFNADMMAGRYHAITAVRLARNPGRLGCHHCQYAGDGGTPVRGARASAMWH